MLPPPPTSTPLARQRMSGDGDPGQGSHDAGEVRPTLDVKRHSAFWLRHLRLLPTAYTSADVQRMTLAYFCLGALDLLGLVDQKVPQDERAEYADWIYAQQLDVASGGGFAPGPYLGAKASGNLAMTYTALINLAILGDDFRRLDRDALRAHLRSLQQPDGSFAASSEQDECDCRFVYCAFAVCEMTDSWSAIDVTKAEAFLLRSRSYDAAFGQAPGQESHGGSTYCALAALALAKRLTSLDSEGDGREANRDSLTRWLAHRQQSLHGGFNGRLEKPEDACYSFWCGASLAILDAHSLVDSASDIEWLLSCQTKVGGIAKTPDSMPDVMHSYLGLAALSLHAHGSQDEIKGADLRQQLKPSLKRLEPRLNMSVEALALLRKHLPLTATS